MELAKVTQRLKRMATEASLSMSDREGADLIRRVRAEQLTYLDSEALSDLRQRAKGLSAGIPGGIIEAGCALGGSAIVLARSKEHSRDLFIYDVFGMIPAPTEKDGSDVKERYDVIASGKSEGIGSDKYYGYEPDLLAKVEENFERFDVPFAANSVHLVKGLFEETMHPSGPIALAHIDGDWYDSVKVCLDRIWPFLSKGGALVIDDYYTWSGCRSAVDDFLITAQNCHVERGFARLHLVKI
jgi:predicted O-methyltransferase YrrM